MNTYEKRDKQAQEYGSFIHNRDELNLHRVGWVDKLYTQERTFSGQKRVIVWGEKRSTYARALASCLEAIDATRKV